MSLPSKKKKKSIISCLRRTDMSSIKFKSGEAVCQVSNQLWLKHFLSKQQSAFRYMWWNIVLNKHHGFLADFFLFHCLKTASCFLLKKTGSSLLEDILQLTTLIGPPVLLLIHAISQSCGTGTMHRSCRAKSFR